MSPLIRECLGRNLEHFVLHTGQHFSHNMDGLFFEELDLPQPKYNLGVGVEPDHRCHVRLMIDRIIDILAAERPDHVLVYGDTNSTLAATLAANRLKLRIAHIEAGLRSFDIIMAEEVNRMLSDHLSHQLFAPTQKAKEHALAEGIPEEKIIVCGNTIVDALYYHINLAKKRKTLEKFCLKPKSFILFTCHRPENVDIQARLKMIFQGLDKTSKTLKLPIVFPAHPRTKSIMARFKITPPEDLKITEPLGYLDFLQLLSEAALAITDSGGIQEEACILKVPCVTVRESTERPETLAAGANVLSDADPERICHLSQEMLQRPTIWENPYGDGNAAKKIIDNLGGLSL